MTRGILCLPDSRTGQVLRVGTVSRQRKEVMSQNTARHDPHAKSGDEDVTDPQGRQPERRQAARPRRPHQPVGQPGDDGPLSPDEPDEDEFELIGDDDLGAADLGPAAPNATDPDAVSGRPRKLPPAAGAAPGDSAVQPSQPVKTVAPERAPCRWPQGRGPGTASTKQFMDKLGTRPGISPHRVSRPDDAVDEATRQRLLSHSFSLVDVAALGCRPGCEQRQVVG
jgi:hypothetical protein